MSEPFISINELSKRLDVPAHTLRYWEREFPAAVRPVTGAGGRRYYRAETVAALERIKELLYDSGYTIAGVRKMIVSGEFSDKDEVETRHGGVKDKKAQAPVKQSTTKSSGDSPREISRAIGFLDMAKSALE